MRINHLKTAAAALLTVSMFMPFAASATEARMEVGAKAKVEGGDMFCTRVTAASGETAKRVGDLKEGLEARRGERDHRLETKRDERADKLTGIRGMQDAHRTSLYAKLDVKANTDAKDQAVAAFRVSVEAAVTVRRNAVNDANAAMQAAVSAAIAKRKAAIDAAVASFTSSVNAALAKAKSDCAKGTDSVTARASFTASVKAAKDKLMADRKAADKITDAVKAAVAVHHAAVEKAFADFKVSVEAARDTLKASLKAAPVEPQQ